MKAFDARVFTSHPYTRFDPRRSFIGRALTVLFLATVLLSISGIPAMAISNTTPFELDRNAVKQTTADDWDNVLGFRTPPSPGSDIGHVFVPDAPATDTTYFTGGGSKDINPISSWMYNSSGAQDKDEITNAYAAAYLVNNGIQLYFGADRYGVTGSSTMGFWFLQNTVTPTGGHFTGAHKDGDILIVSDFPNGGAVSVIKVFKWQSGALVDVTPTGGADCIGAPASAPICATVNQSPTTSPWPYTPKAGSPGTFPKGAFLEGGVNLMSLFPNGTQVPCFASFLAETRASTQPNSTLSDFATGGINTCGEVKGTKFNDFNANGVRDSGEPGLAGWTITATGTTTGNQPFTTSTTTADGTNGTTLGAYTLKDIPPGTYTICETLQTGWNQSDPGASGATCPGSIHGYSVGLSLGQIVTGEDFGNYQNAKLGITKTADKTTVNAGDQIGFTVTLTNSGTGTATGVTLTDSLPGAPGVNWSLDAGGSSIPTGISCAVGGTAPNQSLSCGTSPNTTGTFNLAAGATLTLHVTSPTSSATCGTHTLTNTASFTSNNGGSGSSASVTITVNCPTLVMTKTADKSPVNAGDQIGFTVTLTNTGAGDANGTTLTDTLPTGSGITWTLDTAGSTIPTGISCAVSNASPQVLSCGASPATTGTFTLKAGASISLHVTSPTTAGTCASSPISNTASFGSANDGSGTKSASITVNCPTLVMTKTADKSPVNAGEQIGFTVSLTNTGAGDANGTTLTDTLPSGSGLSWTLDTAGSTIPTGISCAVSNASPQVLSCGASPATTGTFTLKAGASISLHVTSPTTSGTCGISPISNTASFGSSNDGSGTKTASITVNCPNLSISKTADKSSVSAGDQIGYTVTLKNTGAGDALNVSLTDSLPSAPGLTWTLDTAGSTIPTGISCGVSNASPQVLSCGTSPSTTGTFTLKAGATIALHVTSPTTSATCQTGTITNTASFTSSNGGSQSTQQITITVNCPNLTLAKTADKSPVNAGEQIGFTVTLSNTGAGDAKNVTLTDNLPTAGGVTWTLDTAGSTIPTGISCAVSNATPQVLSCGTSPSTTGTFTLPAGAQIKLHVTSPTTSATCASSPLTNTASFTSSNGGTGSSPTASITVNCPSLSLTKTADSTSVNAGEQIGFTVTLKNTGAGAATGVTLTDTLPSAAGVTWSIDQAGSSIPSGISCAVSNASPQVLSCGASPATTGTFTLAAGATLKLHITSPTSSATCQTGTLTNTANFTSNNGGSGSSATVTITVNCPSLQLTKTADNTTVSAGDQIGFTVTLKNNGSGASLNTTLTDTLPSAPGVTWSLDQAGSSIPSGISCAVSNASPQVLSCGTSPSTTGTFTLAAGAQIKLHVTSPTSSATCQTHTLTNTANFTSSNGGSGSSATVTITVNCPNLGITKTADKSSVNSGEQIGFTVTLTNSGAGDAKNVTLTDNLPSAPGVTWSLDTAGSSIPTGISCAVSNASPQVLSCGTSPNTTGTFTLPAGAQIKLHVTSPTSSATCASNTLTNTASFTSSNGGNGSSTSVTITVNCPNLGITKTADNSVVNVGSPIGFTVTLSNTGAGDATGVTLSDNLPSAGGLTWSLDTAGSIIPTGISCAVSNATPQVLSCGTSPSTTGTFTLAAGKTLKLHVTSPTSTATCGATINNTASFTSTNGGSGSSSTVTITVNCAILHVSKTPCPTTAVAGGLLTYTISFSNSGAGPATNAVLVDTIPAGTQVADAGGGTVSGNGSTVTWNLGTIAAGGSGTRTLIVLVTAANGATLHNTVTLSSSTASTSATSSIDTLVSNAGAITHGSSYGIDASLLGTKLLGLDQFGKVATVAPGAPQAAVSEVGPIAIPGVVTIQLLRQTSVSAITATQASSTSTSTVTNVNLLNGAIIADAVHGVSQSYASPQTASYNSGGSNFVGLVIQGKNGPVALANVAPNTSIAVYNPLSPRQKLADVVLYEESGTAGLSNGFWSSSHQLNMIHITLVAPLSPTVPAGAEIIVGHAQSDAKYPSGLACGATPNTVSGKAFTAYANGTLGGNTVVNVQQGDAELPSTGGSNSDDVLAVSIPGFVGTLTATNDTNGTTSPNTQATSSSLVHSTNLLNGLITADLIDVKSSSSATGTLASTSFGSTCGVDACPSGCSAGSPCFVNLAVNGQSIVGINGGTIKPNTTIAIPQPDGSIVLVILNEQILGGDGTKNTEGTINAIHVYVLKGQAINAEVIVASAHSDAHHS